MIEKSACCSDLSIWNLLKVIEDDGNLGSLLPRALCEQRGSRDSTRRVGDRWLSSCTNRERLTSFLFSTCKFNAVNISHAGEYVFPPYSLFYSVYSWRRTRASMNQPVSRRHFVICLLFSNVRFRVRYTLCTKIPCKVSFFSSSSIFRCIYLFFRCSKNLSRLLCREKRFGR